MDLTFLLADLAPQTREPLRAEVRHLAALRDFTYQLYSVKLPGAWTELALEAVSLALIHIDYPDALALGLRLYEANPFCRLIYYGAGTPSVIPLLPSRPVRWLDLSGGAEAMRRCLQEEYDALQLQRGYLHYADRYQMLCVPYSAVLYFTSRDRMVYYQTPLGEQGPLRRTLDQIEAQLEPGCYLRCHKSYLVRTDACRALEKPTRELLLCNGERIPVSRACWESVAAYFAPKP